MRESIGGAFLLKIMVVFIVLYNSLLAIAVNYALTFRVKNQIINILEQNEGCQNSGNLIKDYVASVGFYRALGPPGESYTVYAHRVPNRGNYYTVITYLNFDFPFVSGLVRVSIIGETKLIYKTSENMEEEGICQSIY